MTETDSNALREGWRDMASAPKDGTRVLLAWKPIGGLSEHIELGKWKARYGWCNTYGNPFSGDPDAWSPLAPFALPAVPMSQEGVDRCRDARAALATSDGGEGE